MEAESIVSNQERERLNALMQYQIMDSAPEPEFDDLTRLASHVCGTPIALVSLIDASRQWFKSRHGLDVSETPREVAFCPYTIADGELMEVPDARTDPRFAQNPLVTGDPHIRFYAGTPIFSPTGHGLGTLCVIDRVPRQLSSEQRSALSALGRLVSTQLELRYERIRERELGEHMARKAAYKQAVLDSAGAAIISTNVSGVVLTFNVGAQAMLGYAAEEVVGRITPEVFHDRNEVVRRADELSQELGRPVQPGFEVFIARAQHGGAETRQWTYLRKDGTRLPVELSVTPMRGADGSLLGFLGVATDITARRLAEEALQASEARLRQMNEMLERLVATRTAELRESEARFQQLADQSGDVFRIIALDPHRVVYVSPSIQKIWGVPAATFYADPMQWLAFVHPEDRDRVREALAQAIAGQLPRLEIEYRIVRPDGAMRWVSDTGTPIRDQAGVITRFGGIAKDITEAKQAQAQWLRGQRLESIGTLAGGIAHDLNNALAPIMMGIDMVRTQSSQDATILETMRASARHAGGMVKQLLTFAKGADGERVQILPSHLLTEISALVRGTFPKNIRFELSSPARLSPIVGDPTQLHQVLLNLCVNARDAMPNGGMLRVEAEVVDIDATYAEPYSASPGRYLAWRVIDTGTGIPPDLLDRIFEPFFTTKAPEKGTGLGLSTLLGIVKSHRGFVAVQSTVGRGTTVTVHLPVGEGRGAAGQAADSSVSFRGNGETILVLDDVESVREVSRAVLTHLNFNVLTACEAADALVLLAEHKAAVSLIITDFHMPHLDGLNFARIAKRMVPGVPIIVSSGRVNETDAREFRQVGCSAILEKPYTQRTLVDALQRVLGAGDAAA